MPTRISSSQMTIFSLVFFIIFLNCQMVIALCALYRFNSDAKPLSTGTTIHDDQVASQPTIQPPSITKKKKRKKKKFRCCSTTLHNWRMSTLSGRPNSIDISIRQLVVIVDSSFLLHASKPLIKPAHLFNLYLNLLRETHCYCMF